MSLWHVGTVVCRGCGKLLNVKSLSDNIICYLCDSPIDLSDLPVVEQADEKPEAEASELNE